MIRITIEIDPSTGNVMVNQPSSISMPIEVSSEQESSSAPFEENADVVAEEQKALRQAELARQGMEIFATFVATWRQNFGVENTEQPDRANLLDRTLSDYSIQVFSFIRYSGGLTNAVMNVLIAPNISKEDIAFRQECRLLAENMSQVASIICPPLVDYLEYPFKIDPSNMALK